MGTPWRLVNPVVRGGGARRDRRCFGSASRQSSQYIGFDGCSDTPMAYCGRFALAKHDLTKRSKISAGALARTHSASASWLASSKKTKTRVGRLD